MVRVLDRLQEEVVEAEHGDDGCDGGLGESPARGDAENGEEQGERDGRIVDGQHEAVECEDRGDRQDGGEEARELYAGHGGTPLRQTVVVRGLHVSDWTTDDKGDRLSHYASPKRRWKKSRVRRRISPSVMSKGCSWRWAGVQRLTNSVSTSNWAWEVGKLPSECPVERRCP